jgi:hypothetical protein
MITISMGNSSSLRGKTQQQFRELSKGEDAI